MTMLDAESPGFDPPRTSRMAIASLVSSLVCCLPLTTIPAVVLGISAMVSISRNPALRGRGVAVAGILLGVMFTAAQAFIYPAAYRSYALYTSGPTEALRAGYDGDLAAFQAWFVGPGATASPDEAAAFIGVLEQRYGQFIRAAPVGPSGNGAVVACDYQLFFTGAQRAGEIELAFSDPKTHRLIFKLQSITVADEQLGNVSYPPVAFPAITAPPAPPAPDAPPAGGSQGNGG